jgi:post-segregation antitoxin (ccd killing protein)
MVNNPSIIKVTFNIPSDLKERASRLKDELHISMSALYKDAIDAYVKQKEREKWENAAKLMRKEYENNPELKEWVEFEDEIYDNSSK